MAKLIVIYISLFLGLKILPSFSIMKQSSLFIRSYSGMPGASIVQIYANSKVGGLLLIKAT